MTKAEKPTKISIRLGEMIYVYKEFNINYKQMVFQNLLFCLWIFFYIVPAQV